jgi:serine/threonine protein kinase
MLTDVANWVGLGLADGRYQVTAQLGEGGMGLVYRAHDRHLDAEVVVKVPRQPGHDDAEFAQRFAREIRSLVRLAHPHIVKVTDFGTHGGHPFAVMQYLAGGCLKDRQRLGGGGQPLPMPVEDLFGWLEDAASALDFIHEQKYVHRDIKPANILFDQRGNAYLSDFGLAKVMADAEPRNLPGVTGAGIILGTAEYMAPELIMGRSYDGRADQYALAVTVHEMLHGRVPFEGPTPTAILVKHTVQKPPALHELQPTLSRSLALVVLKALAKEPQERYESCTTFARALLATFRRPPAAATLAGPALAPPVRPARVRIPCPSCRRSFELPPGSEGKRLRCPNCRQSFQAPTRGEPAETRQGLPAADLETVRHTAPAIPPPPGLPGPPITRAAGLRVLLEQKCLWGHQGPVLSVAFSADGRLALSGSADATMRLWDLESGQERCRFMGHGGPVNKVAFSPDGYYVLSGGADGTVRLWNVETGRELHRFIGHTSEVTGAAFSSDNSRILSGGKDGSLRLWDVEEGRQLRHLVGPAAGVLCVGLAPDGRHALAGGADGIVYGWEMENGAEVTRLTGHAGPVTGLAFSPRGGCMVSGGLDRSVRLWDLAAGREAWSGVGHLNGVTGVAFGPDGRRVVSASQDNTLALWNVTGGPPMASCLGHTGGVGCVACAPNGPRMLSGGSDHTLRVW